MSGVIVSKKHGVNPSVILCFTCLEPTGVALNGRLPGDVEAPRNVVIPGECCEKCKRWMEMGIILIAVKNKTKEDNLFSNRAGLFSVIKEEAFIRMGEALKDGSVIENGLKARFCFFEEDVWDYFGLPRHDIAEQPVEGITADEGTEDEAS